MTIVSQSLGLLRQLAIDVDDARASVALLRGDAEQQRRRFQAAQARLRRLLETYEATLSDVGLPLPHRLRVELGVYRSLTDIEGRGEVVASAVLPTTARTGRVRGQRRPRAPSLSTCVPPDEAGEPEPVRRLGSPSGSPPE